MNKYVANEYKDVATTTKTIIQTVRNVHSKWNQHHAIRDLPKPGRPSKLDDRTKRRLARMAQSGEVSSATDLVASHDIVQISASIARNMLHQEGLKAMHMVERPLLTRAHKRRRLEFARAHRDWTVDDWKQVIFSDETVITARPLHTHKLKWVRSLHELNPRLIVPTVRGGGPAIMTWGCISTFGFHDFILLDGTINAAGYVKFFGDNLVPVMQEYFQHRPCMFQQDNAAVHTAHEVTSFFRAHNIQALDWPAQSPDRNIIEHVWHYLKEAMRMLPVVSSKEELWSNVKEALQHMWSSEMTKKFNDLYESLSNRMQAVIAAHGGNTSY
ncbi:hypothetical protein EON65_56010 [archaeon]|nr:MAG: hypothetical protein EON65_56010 [archaeon]